MSNTAFSAYYAFGEILIFAEDLFMQSTCDIQVPVACVHLLQDTARRCWASVRALPGRRALVKLFQRMHTQLVCKRKQTT